MTDETPSTPPAPQTPPPAPQGQPPASGGDTAKLLAVFGYLTGIVALIAILIEPYKDDKFVRHHAMQALALAVAWILDSVIYAIPVLGWIAGPIISIALLVFAIMGAVKAWQGEMWEMPVVYGVVKQYI
ncbi:MAG: DUF4870 domain-containing protein [Anaerosomatales bacterium]|nr:DUF4870 domain-containing protein [Anaerosomatales bacterium]